MIQIILFVLAYLIVVPIYGLVVDKDSMKVITGFKDYLRLLVYGTVSILYVAIMTVIFVVILCYIFKLYLFLGA